MEKVLLHIVGLDGEWIWSGVVEEHVGIWDLQLRLRTPYRRTLVGAMDWYVELVYRTGVCGPLPDLSLIGTIPMSFTVSGVLCRIGGVRRSEDTQEMWIAGVKTLMPLRRLVVGPDSDLD